MKIGGTITPAMSPVQNRSAPTPSPAPISALRHKNSPKPIAHWSLATIAAMPNLRQLVISGTGITDSGLLHLKTLNKLERLDINRTSITDDGLINLRFLDTLVVLDVEIGEHITTTGVDNLKSHLPNCTIECWDMEPDGSGVLAETR